jgi:hypothetical protein
MPTQTGIIDAVTTPPLSLLQQVLDTNGPYGAGIHTLTQFHTDGAFLLPAGTYDVGGTYGLIARLHGAIPLPWGYEIGWNDGASQDESFWDNRLAQVVVQRQLPITSAWVTTSKFDLHEFQRLELWPLFIGGGSRIGLYVAPDIEIDLFYMCLL